MDALPDNKPYNLQLFILDPLSVIIKLAILSNKPIGTKICIHNNVVYLQEPGPFQSICRIVFKNNKTDLHYFYNPIELACQHYLTQEVIKRHPKIKEIFSCAQNGLLKLIETYKNCPVMRICLNYYLSLISNHLDNKNNDTLFKKDNMTQFYTTEVLNKLTKIWTQDKITIVLNLTTFLSNDESAEMNVKSLENIIDGIDKLVSSIIH
jgi:hypothetical protein